MSDTRQRWLWAMVCLAFVSLPFLAVDFVPSTDLPQHLGQLRLFAEAWSDPAADLKIQWWTPYGLVYAFMAVPWALFSPVVAGRVTVWLLVALQVAVIHFAAAKWQRPVTGAVLATSFIFHVQLYWGFLNFLFGFLVFGWWYWLSRRSEEDDLRNGWRTAALFMFAAGVLYLSHALWFACGLLWLAVEALVSRRSLKSLWWRALGAAPVVLVALYWFAFLSGSSFSSPPNWVLTLAARLSTRHLTLAALGGVRHGIESIVVLVAIIWLVAAVVSRRKEPNFGCDTHLLSLAGLFFVLYIALPDKFANTICFSTRWVPFLFLSLLLAVGRPKLRPVMRRVVVVVLLLTHMVVTTAYWLAFEKEELTGLTESLAAIKGEPRVIGLSYLGESRYFKGQPFIQVFSWTYAVHGGVLNFSFGDFAPSLVIYDEGDFSSGSQKTRRPTAVTEAVPPPENSWSVGLEWFPKAVRRSDFRFFDYALVGGEEEAHQKMVQLPDLSAVVTEGRWRLYRIDSPGALADPREGSTPAPAEP